MTRDQRTSLRIVATICAVLAAAILPSLMGTAKADLPPRPDLPGTEPGGGGPPAGAQIVLRATFSPNWPHQQVHWQALWTVVEWQDPGGAWHVVEGWRGTLDKVMVDDSGNVIGEKAWWVYKPNLGQGPFRWLVYEGQGGRLVASSTSFDLPEAVDQHTIIEVSLTP